MINLAIILVELCGSLIFILYFQNQNATQYKQNISYLRIYFYPFWIIYFNKINALLYVIRIFSVIIRYIFKWIAPIIILSKMYFERVINKEDFSSAMSCLGRVVHWYENLWLFITCKDTANNIGQNV